MALFLPLASVGAPAALTVVTHFEGASLRVLALDPETQTIRIRPGGNAERGGPCWWYFRLHGVEVARPLVLPVLANTSPVKIEGGAKTKKVGADWSLREAVALASRGFLRAGHGRKGVETQPLTRPEHRLPPFVAAPLEHLGLHSTPVVPLG